MKRGSSGLSLVVGVNKPTGMSSHDVVNSCRRIFGERRVGHTGTLDPIASGVLPICVGPATRLDQYLTGHDKSYRATMRFGFETTTDDSEGEPTVHADVPGDMLDGDFAEAYIAGLAGEHEQLPPAYSAIKVNGKKAYELARSGSEVELQPRTIQVLNAQLIERHFDAPSQSVEWVVDFKVSKGTYIRSLIRDIARELGTCAHMSQLQRTSAGALRLQDCISLETLQALGTAAALDPLKLLGIRYAFADDCARFVQSGTKLFAHQVQLNEPLSFADAEGCACCTTSVTPSTAAPANSELVGIVVDNRLKALYEFDASTDTFKPACVFNIGISRE